MATIIKGKNRNRPYTVRYFHEGRQREKSFRTSREASDFRIKFEHDSREQIFVDPARANTPFRAYADNWLELHSGTAKTKANYELLLRKHIYPAMGGRRLGSIASDREGLARFLREMDGGPSWKRSAYVVISAVINDAVRNGWVPQNRIRGMDLPAMPRTRDFVFPTRNQVRSLALAMPDGYEGTVYLMRGCGLRIGEALGLFAEDFDFGAGTLRLRRQLTPDGKDYAPLKHRGEDDYRDVPVPSYALDAVQVNEGDLFRKVSRRQYGDWFNRAKASAGIEGHFTPHSLRHAFASVCLAQGVPITDLSHWLGHRSIQTTFGIYGHLVPSSWGRARDALNEEWNAA